MNMLAIDTATDQFSVALASGKDTWLFEANAGLRHSELVMDSIDMLMHRASLQPNDINAIVCMGGPGSFTGLRIGFSLAKGLALPLSIPIAAVPTLDCMAWPFSAWPGTIMPVLDAKKGAFFCTLFRNGKQLCPDMDAAPAEIVRVLQAQVPGARVFGAQVPDPTLLIGPGAEMLYAKLLDLNIDHIDQIKTEKRLPWGNAETLLRIAEERKIFDSGNVSDYSIGPEYIRKSDAELGTPQ